jgi:hypothetical protein
LIVNYLIKYMDTIVTKEILPLSLEDKKGIRKNTIISIVAVAVIETIAYLMIFKFIDTSDFGIGRMIFFGFFLLVGAIIIFINVSSYFDQNKIVSVGYVTHKRSETRGGGRNSSSSTNYYFTLGNDEISVMINHYSQVAQGDKIKMHQTKWNKSIFKIEILERAMASEVVPSPYEINQLELHTTEDYLDKDEKSLVRGKLMKLLFWRGLVLGGVAYVLYYIFFLVIFLSLPKDIRTNYAYLFVYVPVVLSVGLYLIFNKKTYKVFKDLSEGKKRICPKIVTDVIENNKPMVGKNIVVTSGRSGIYHYITTHDKFFYSISSEMGNNLKGGDQILVHESLYSKIALKVLRG